MFSNSSLMETKLFSERVKIENCVVESTSYQGNPDQDLVLSVSWSKNCAQALRARGQPRLNYLNEFSEDTLGKLYYRYNAIKLINSLQIILY